MTESSAKSQDFCKFLRSSLCGDLCGVISLNKLLKGAFFYCLRRDWMLTSKEGRKNSIFGCGRFHAEADRVLSFSGKGVRYNVPEHS